VGQGKPVSLDHPGPPWTTFRFNQAPFLALAMSASASGVRLSPRYIALDDHRSDGVRCRWAGLAPATSHQSHCYCRACDRCRRTTGATPVAGRCGVHPRRLRLQQSSTNACIGDDR